VKIFLRKLLRGWSVGDKG